jgi:carboxyl-terminal processing protease
VVPDVAFPTIYDTEEIGESALDHALNWDQINPVRHHQYNDLTTVLPHVTTLFQERSEHNPDFIYLEDQIDLAQKTRDIKELPLNEEVRIALRDSQEEKALNIENKLRLATGEELLTSLDDDEEEVDEDAETSETDSDADTDSDPDATVASAEEDEDEEEEAKDVLLTEAGSVLVDALLLKQQRYAVHSRKAAE